MRSQPVHMIRRSAQAGMTLIETMIALAILFTITVGLMAMATVAMMTTENQGHLGARTAEYAQDKMEQLLSLAYTDGDLKPPPDASDTASAACFPSPTPASPASIHRRSWIPVRARIQSSEVSIRAARSSLVTTREGRARPVPRIRERMTKAISYRLSAIGQQLE